MMLNEFTGDITNQWDESANNEGNGGLILSDEDDEVLNLEEQEDNTKHAGADRSTLLMKFCPHDSSMLYPRELKSSRALQYACRLCDYCEASPQSSMIYRNILVKEAKNALHTVPGNVSDDPTLPRSHDAECSNCGYNVAVFFRSDTGQSGSLALIYVCTNCAHKWVDSQKQTDDHDDDEGFE